MVHGNSLRIEIRWQAVREQVPLCLQLTLVAVDTLDDLEADVGEYGAGYVCRNHEDLHATHDDYGGMMGVYNSPRSGVCGYGGPAEPPC